MYIIAIGWLYVTTLMAVAETNIVAGVLTFLLYGIFPVAILLFLFGTPARRRVKAAREKEQAMQNANLVGVTADQLANQPDRSDAKADQ